MCLIRFTLVFMASHGCRLLQPGEHYRRLGHDGLPRRQRLHSPPAQHAHQQGKLARIQDCRMNDIYVFRNKAITFLAKFGIIDQCQVKMI